MMAWSCRISLRSFCSTARQAGGASRATTRSTWRSRRERGVGFVLDTATWRANPDWGAKLGYDAQALKAINVASIALLEELRAEWESADDALRHQRRDRPARRRLQGRQYGCRARRKPTTARRSRRLPATNADMVSAYTLTNIDEAIGIARAAKAHGMPCAISFTVETDGRLVTGKTLREAIEAVDRETGGYPLYYLINCAHPTHFEQRAARPASRG